MRFPVPLLALLLFLNPVLSHAEKLNDTNLRKFLDPIQYAAVDISPSGKYISFIRRDDEKNTLIVMDLATMKPTASVKYGEKGKTSKLNVCCTKWVTDELLSYGTLRKRGTEWGRGVRATYIY